MQSLTMLEPEVEKSHPNAPRRTPQGLTGSVSFGGRLRAERERRQISIASIADKTKILGALLEGLENNDVSRWPATGFYRRAFIRAYAVAIGLDPDPVVREFVERFPEAEEPTLPAPQEADAAASAIAGNHPLLRLTLADTGHFFAAGPVLRSILPRLRAVALDAFVLGVIGLSLFVFLGTLWAPLTVAVAVYYFGSILILGNTPGVCLFAKSKSDREAGRQVGR